jgi:cell division protein FtsZ
MNFNLINESDDSSIIKVIGVGGGGSNAVHHMFNQGIIGVDFAICNTDSQAMENSEIPTRIQLGPTLTEGRGAGSKPNIGKLACEESIEEVKQYLSNGCKMLFITAGMGGGTGTGAAPIIAKAAQEMDILTVGIVTLPFTFEGRRRSTQGYSGLEELKKYVDTLIIISNDKLRQIHGNLSLSHAFSQADDILTTAAKGIAEIITVAGYVNVDFEDVNTVMRNSGVAIMGTASAEGEGRAKKAVDEALNSPLLEDNNIRGAKHILLNITSGSKEVTMDEIFQITEFVQEEAGYGTDLIWGNCFDENLGDKINVTVIATGFERNRNVKSNDLSGKVVVTLEDEDQLNKMSSRPKIGLNDVTSGLDAQHEPEIKMEQKEPDASLGQNNTFEFKDIPARSIQSGYSYEEPYMQGEEKERLMTVQMKYEMDEKKRRARLMENRVKLSNPNSIARLENEPAYLRREVILDDVIDNTNEDHSEWTISADEPQPRRNNTFLHDNVD